MRVLCHGCFDILHIGHKRHLEAAARLGDFLIVSVTPDKLVNKGDGRPVFELKHRIEMLEALRCVNLVMPFDSPERAIQYWSPEIYVKGKEYEGKLREQELVERLGGRVVFTDELVRSSTALVPHV